MKQKIYMKGTQRAKLRKREPFNNTNSNIRQWKDRYKTDTKNNTAIPHPLKAHLSSLLPPSTRRMIKQKNSDER